MVPATSIALSLDQQGLWRSLHCTNPNTNLYGYILFRGHPNSFPRKAPWQKCLGKFGETSQWLTTDWVQESVCLKYKVATQECFGKETHEPCTVSRHTVCTHKSNRALQRALGTLRATCKPHCLHQENLLPQPKQPGAQTDTQKQPYTACALRQAQGQRFPSTRRRDDAAPPLPNGGAGPTCLQTV